MKITHRKLVAEGRLWLMNAKHCNPVFSERGSAKLEEMPDGIGWNSGNCIVIECKISRQDFLNDLKKPHRIKGGLGNLRYYLIPDYLENDIKLENGWGLVVVHSNGFVQQKRFCNSKEFPRDYEKEVCFLRSRIFEIQRYGQ